jgi:hypothetical protein
MMELKHGGGEVECLNEGECICALCKGVVGADGREGVYCSKCVDIVCGLCRSKEMRELCVNHARVALRGV